MVALIFNMLLDTFVTPVVFHQFGKRALKTYFRNEKQIVFDDEPAPKPVPVGKGIRLIHSYLK